MQFLRPTLAAAVLTAAAAAGAEAQTATQTVSYEVAAINQISVAGAPSLVVNAATAGSQPGSASASGTYSITTNEAGVAITAELSEAMPSGVTLTANLAAPTVGSSAGAVELGTEPRTVVSGIGQTAESGLSIGYGLSATVAAGVVPAASVTVTYTVTTGN